MIRPGTRGERAWTASLRDLIVSDAEARQLALSVLAPGLPAKANWRALTEVETAKQKRIDLLLLAPGEAVIVEVKTRDAIKAFQFDLYEEHVQNTFGIPKPQLVWLVHRARPVLGEVAAKALMVTWHDLATKLRTASSLQAREFADALERSGLATLSPGIGSKRCVGYELQQAVRVLQSIRTAFPDIEGGIEENAGTPLSLHVGRTTWPLEQKRRVWFYFQPNGRRVNEQGPFTFTSQIILYHKNFGPWDRNLVAKWAGYLADLGCELRRSGLNDYGRPSWGHHHQMPFRASSVPAQATDLLYVYAIIPRTQMPKFDWCDETTAIESGRQFLAGTLDIIERCLGI